MIWPEPKSRVIGVRLSRNTTLSDLSVGTANNILDTKSNLVEERKTAEKELKRLQRLISSEPTSDSPIPPATLPTALHIARANIAYTRFSPLAEKYIAIYPAEKSKKKTRSSGDADASDDEAEEVELDYTKRQAPTYPHLMLSKEGKPERWLDVEACLTPVKDISEANDKTISNFSGAELKKLNLLRDRDLPQVPQTTRSSQKDSTAAVAQDKKAKDVKYPAGKDTAKDKAKSTDAPKEDNRRKRREAARAAEAVREVEMKDDDGNSSDGGFFE